jgi:single-stranded-DNA-specific exonuclease
VIFARSAPGEVKGSGRSIAGFHLRDALDLVAKRAPGCIARFGGHAFAAGLSLPEAALPAFTNHLEAVAREQLSGAHLRRALETDGALAPGELDIDLARLLQDAVWGQGFPPPLFDDTFAIATQRTVGGSHLRLTLSRGTEHYTAILFNRTEPLPPRVHVAYRPDVNAWNGTLGLQLVIEHWQEAP